jgi:hypothetical protein
MHKITSSILLILLVVISYAANAEWVKVSDNDYATVYVDRSAINIIDNIVTMWDMFDLKEPQKIDGKKYFSMTEQIEYDCKEKRSKVIESSYYDGNMGRGTITHGYSIFDIEREKWSTILPGSLVEVGFLEIACERLSHPHEPVNLKKDTKFTDKLG